MYKIILLIFAVILFACSPKQNTIGTIERIDPSLDSIVSKNASVEVIADGFEWSEGPLWVESKKMLLFSDVPKNTIYST